MNKFIVTERQVRIVEYHVDAESESDARSLVGNMGCDDHTVLIDFPEYDITEVVEVEQPKPVEHEYAFDVMLVAAVRVKAHSEDEARTKLKAEIDCNSANLGAWPDGEPILAEVSLNEVRCLYEIDGEGTL
jgi:uncharacterized protein with GYD domain